jgi:biopolymer transport protein ExbD
MQVPSVRQTGSVSINMTPMIDVVFLLIIFFLVSSHLAKQENRVKLNLPEATTGLPEEQVQRSVVTLNVLPDGNWQLAGQSLTIPQLVAALTERNREVGGILRVRIRTDRDVPYGKVSPILSACVQAQATDIVFAVYETPPKK